MLTAYTQDVIVCLSFFAYFVALLLSSWWFPFSCDVTSIWNDEILERVHYDMKHVVEKKSTIVV